MKKITAIVCSVFFALSAFAQDELDEYVERLKTSKKNFGSETAFMSIGSDFLYAQEYFEAKNYSSAASGFMSIVNRDSNHAFASYQLAVSLLKQNDKYKAQQAQQYLEKAFALKPFLRERFTKDVPQTQTPAPQNNLTGLDAYIEKLKYSRSTGGKETEMNTAGREVMYGYEYYEKGEYLSAATSFYLAIAKEPQNPYINYLLGVSLMAQGKSAEAKQYLDKAFAGDASLKIRSGKDITTAIAQHKKYEDGRKIKTNEPTKPVYGGKLTYGTYVCKQTVYNGAKAGVAFSYIDKGSFTLKKDGTYRWLDNGVTGKFSYDTKSGSIKWLSGYFAAAPPKSSMYQPNKTVAQITLTYSDSYRWECGCNK